MLKKEKNYEFRKRMSIVHEENLRDESLIPNSDELEIKDGARIVIPTDAGKVLKTVAFDFCDYLLTSMNVSVSVLKGLDKAMAGDIVLATSAHTGEDLGEFATYKGVRANITDRLSVTGFDERGIAFGLYFIEDLMTFRKAPFLKKGIFEKKPMYSPQMVHSGYGLDEYPEEHLANIAHEGRDAILVFVKDVDITPYGYLDFNDLIERAEKYGLDVYAYSYLHSDVHPDASGAEAYYEASYGKLFQKCPKLRGVTLVGESVAFPSKDPHTTGLARYAQSPDGIPNTAIAPGWYPCCDFPIFLNLLKKIISKYNPDADIVFWTYNWGRVDEEARVALIKALPEGITLQATFEMFQTYDLDGVIEPRADYTVSFEGPGEYFASEAKAAAERNIKLYSMTNTGGLTWDFGVIPYEPFPYQWMRRYKKMEEFHDTCGLCGLMESHHYGFYPSFISKLSKWLFTEPRENPVEILHKIIGSEFGCENVEKVDRALDLWSDAIRHYTPTNPDQYGAFRVGPSYPLIIGGSIRMRAASYAMFGSGICSPGYGADMMNPRQSFPSLAVPKEVESLKVMRSLLKEGIDLMESVENKNDKLLRLINMGRFMHNCVTTGIHAKEMYIYTSLLRVTTDKAELHRIADEMETIVRNELENARDTIPLVEVDSRLGWEPSMEYMTDVEHLEWKIRAQEYALNHQFKNLRLCIDK